MSNVIAVDFRRRPAAGLPAVETPPAAVPAPPVHQLSAMPAAPAAAMPATPASTQPVAGLTATVRRAQADVAAMRDGADRLSESARRLRADAAGLGAAIADLRRAQEGLQALRGQARALIDAAR
jgi:hypothetical protein